jgi:hypothetical protein
VVLLDHTNVGAENITLPGTAAYNQQRLWILTSKHFYFFLLPFFESVSKF